MMIRHGRMAEVRDLVAGRGAEDAADRLASFLAGQGDVEAAMQVLNPFIEEGSPNTAVLAAELLERDGRVDEAIEVMRREAERGHEDWVIYMFSELLIRHGRADEVVAFIGDARAAAEDETLLAWVRAMAASGRRREATAELRAHPDAGKWWIARHLADLLTGEGQLNAAVTVLLQPGCTQGGNRTLLATLLVQADRADDAIAVSHVRTPRSPSHHNNP